MKRVATVLLAAAGIAVAGCGGSSSSPSGNQQQPNGQRPDSSQLGAFQACLKKQGVTLPGGPEQGQGSQSQPPQMSEKMQKAMSACQDKLPQGGAGGGPPGGGQIPQRATGSSSTS